MVIDIDGVIGSNPDAARKVISEWIKEAQIILFTSRCRRHQKEETEKLLKRWGIPYDELVLNKPEGDVYIDDNALEFKSWDDAQRRLTRFIEEPHEWGKKKR